MSSITLTTLNARYSHTSLGLRYLHANMGELRGDTQLREFTINERPIDIAEQLLADEPHIIGLGVYIWNLKESTELAGILKRVAPEVTLVLGGPEVSFADDPPAIDALADHVIGGPGDLAFAALCRRLLAGDRPPERFIPAPPVDLNQIALPYAQYSDQDLAQRVLYVEASRGCPFGCEFCLSALDRRVTTFGLERFLDAMEQLWQRGARRFKFVDRTFNLKLDHSAAILAFFLERLDADTFLHFELIPDHLPERLREIIRRFPPGTLQFEVGIQSLSPEVQERIDRRQNNDRSEENLRYLRHETHAHIHADLIIGLPGEGLASFARGFDRLYAMGPHEVQVGILKRLRGTPIIRHTEAYGLRFAPDPPYNVLTTDQLDFATLQRLARFARYWELIANSGRFPHTLPLLLGDSPFERFLAFTDWLFAATGQTHKISLERQFELLYRALVNAFGMAEERVVQALDQDFLPTGLKRVPPLLQGKLTPPRGRRQAGAGGGPERQARHRAGERL